MKHADIIKKLTIEEKCWLLSGKDFWTTVPYEGKGIPSVILSDGPHGIRRQEGADDQLGIHESLPATCFPTAATVANSWNVELGEEIGAALGEEAACQRVSVLLGPGLNIKRSPLCGRNFEYFSEDPYLAGKLAAAYIRGIQKNGVAACPKHFAVNNTELRRQSSNSVLDERTFREIYLTGFEIAVKEGKPRSIMSSYNMINGVYANENHHLLQEILRDEWGFDGFVVTDWGACNDFVNGLRAGSNLEMPTTGGDSPMQLQAAIYEGRISEAEVDKRVDELLDVILQTKEAIRPFEGKAFDMDAHHALAQKAAEESLVLLKNEDAILPLKGGTKVAVIGDFAQKPRYQGAGSSIVNPTRLDVPVACIKDYPLDVIGFAPGFPRVGEADPVMRKDAVELAQRAEVVLLYLGLDEISESEGLDREHMKLPEKQIELLKALSAVNRNVVIVLSAGSAVEMPWLDYAKALLHTYLGGQAGARAALRALVGEVNPSGKLNETYPMRYEDSPTAPYFPAKERSVEYREGLYIGYRYFETAHIPVRFPFGFGLSYTSFAYSDLRIDSEKVSFTLTNTGKRDGAEVAQLYIGAEKPRVYRPAKELKGFRKVYLKAGESKTVTIPLEEMGFRSFNPITNHFEVDSGSYRIMVGASASDIRLSGSTTVFRSENQLSSVPDIPRCYWNAEIRNVSDADFEKLLGFSIPDGRWSGALQMNDSICQLYYAKSLKARLVYKLLDNKLKKSIETGKPDIALIFAYNMPFRCLGKMSGGAISQEMCEGLLTMSNGHAIAFFKGLAKLIAATKKQRKNLDHAKDICC